MKIQLFVLLSLLTTTAYAADEKAATNKAPLEITADKALEWNQTDKTYVARGKSVPMQYFEAPPEVFEEREAMQGWVQMAYGAAVRAREATAPRKTPRRARNKPRAAKP